MNFKPETSKFLITGGTGSFGAKILAKLLSCNAKEIRILSRDEKKQEDIRKKYNDDRIVFFIGDVRDYDSIRNAFENVDYVFHAAALKQVPSCEFFPIEAVKTNILGSDNVITACREHHVKKAVFLSTDKAAYPINAMGMTKALMEKNIVARSKGLTDKDTLLCLTRYGNVIGSRGSVIPLFIRQAAKNEPLTITNPEMTRFMMTLEDAVDLVLFAFERGQQGELFIHRAPACDVATLARAVIEITNSKSEISIIGTRHGEKIHETLITAEIMAREIEMGDYFKIPPDNRDLNYAKYETRSQEQLKIGGSFSSNSTQRLSFEEVKSLIRKVDLWRDE
jgi:UDP-glucose 4-epimerase